MKATVKNSGWPRRSFSDPDTAPEKVLASETTEVAIAKCDAEKARRQRCIKKTVLPAVPSPETNCSVRTMAKMPW